MATAINDFVQGTITFGGLVIVPAVSLITPKISNDATDNMFDCYSAKVVVSAKKSLGE